MNTYNLDKIKNTKKNHSPIASARVWQTAAQACHREREVISMEWIWRWDDNDDIIKSRTGGKWGNFNGKDMMRCNSDIRKDMIR